MPMESLSVRLTRLMEAGKLTVADLAYWLGRPHATVRLWVKGTTAPGGRYLADLAYHRVLLLEHHVRAGFVIPEMSAHKRPEFIRQARNAAERPRSIPARDIA